MELEEEVRQLREALMPVNETPVFLQLTQNQGKIFAMLWRRPGHVVRTSFMMEMIWPEGSGHNAEVEISKIRKKLRRYGAVIHSRWGEGFWLSQEDRDRLERLQGFLSRG